MSLKDSLNELAHEGSPVDLELAASESEPCKLEIEHSSYSEIFELEDGRTGYLLDVRITNASTKSLYVADLDLRVPWKREPFDWLQPQTVTIGHRGNGKTDSYEHYKFPGKSGLELPTEDVINHALMFGKHLSPWKPVSGWLLATGGPMPQDLFHGGWVDLALVVITTDHGEYSERIDVRTDHLERRTQRATRKSDLFERPLESRARNGTELRGHEVLNRRERATHHHRAQ